MSDVISHKCPNCDGPLLFDPENQVFHCEYCLSKFSEPEIVDHHFSEQEDNLKETKEHMFNLYHCPSCGGEVVTDETTAATFCYYCHNPVVLSDRVSGDFLPNAMLPFTVSKEEAQEAFLTWAQKKKFIPKHFFNAEQIEKMTGVYFPYWNVDAKVKGSTNAKATKIDVWRSGDTEYTRTRTYNLIRKGYVSFHSLTKNALAKNTKQKMIECVQPFPVEKAKMFNTQYLSGFQAEKRDIEFSELEEEVKKELNDYTGSVLMNDTAFYTTVTNQQTKSKIVEQSNQYLLLPLWIITYQDHKKNKTYYYAMNGVTSKVGGILPIKKSRLLTVAGLIGAVVTGIFVAGGYLFL